MKRFRPKSRPAHRGNLNLVRLEDRVTPTTLFALDPPGLSILRFDSATPGTLSLNKIITGLNSGESVMGIDFRPADGAMYGVTSQNRLLTIDTATGASTLVATLAADPTDGTNPFTALNGTKFGVDFNPVADRLRVVSDTNQNLRINPANGLVVTDSDLNPGTPDIVGAAYSNNVSTATATTLFVIDSNADTLLTQNANAGTLTIVGNLGIDTSGAAGFDIAGDGTAFAALNVGGAARLFTVNLNTGLATLLGQIAGAATIVTGLAVQPPPNPGPSNLSLFIGANFDENAPAGLIGSFTNPDGDAHTVTIDFDDGSAPVVLNLAAGESNFQVNHTYLDDDPSGTVADSSTVTVTVSDGVNTISGTQNTLIQNVAPSNAAVTATPVTAGGTSTITVTFSDPGTLDPHLILFDFGDGSATQNLGVAPGKGTFTTTHKYSSAGTFTITATVSDDDLGTATPATGTVVVAPPNILPHINDIQNITVPFGGFSPVVPFFVVDVETAAANLTVSATSSNPALVSNPGVVFGGSGTNRTLVISPNAGQTGTATITVTVTDGNGGTVSDTFTVSVDAPAALPAPPTGVTVQEAAGANPASIQGAVDAFRALIGGGTTPGAAGSFGGIRREINWDGVPATKLNPFPGDFFNTTSPRGVLLSTDGTGLIVSGDVGTAQFEFADVTPQQGGPAEFSSFSSPKLFATLGSNTYDIEFRLPGTNIPAGVNAFGIVFTDVDLANISKMDFFAADGTLLVSRDVLPTGVTNEGLSFLGIQLPAGQLAAKVRVTTGDTPIDSPFQFPPPDGVAVDDFIFSEPVVLPPDHKTDIFAVGSGPGVEAQVNVFNANGSLRFALLPFPGFRGGVNVSTGDVNGDGFDDVAVGAGASGGPHVKIFNGETGELLKSYFAYDASFRGGVYVGLGDVTRDGRADLVTGTGPGGGPHVKVFHGVTDAVVHNFFAYEASFRGGVSVRAGDVNVDGFADLITGAGPNGGPRIRAFSGTDLTVLQDFFAADPNARDGVLVGTANFDGKPGFEIIGAVGGRIGVFGITDGTSNTNKYIEQDNLIVSTNGTRIAPAAIRLDSGIIAILIGAVPPTGTTLAGPKVRVIDIQGNSLLNFDALDSAFLGGVSVG